jgi:DNA polymerase
VRIRLPSGRDLIYHEMGVVERTTGWSGVELAFMGVDQLTHQWCQQRTYGGRLVENITQAVARDVLADLMLTLHERGHRIVGSVHDEVLLEVAAEHADALLTETLALARTPPAWAEGLPVNAEGFVSPRYRKA